MLTAEQHAIRSRRVGASEIGALIDYYSPRPDGERVDPHKTAFDVFAARDCPSTDEADHQRWGLDVESAILQNYAHRAGLVLAPSPGTLTHPTIDAICATPDALGITTEHRYRDLQAKNAQAHQVWRWGRIGTDNAPLLYVGQVTIEVGIVKARYVEVEDVGDLIVSLGGAPPVRYPIQWDSELFGQLVMLAEKFKRDHLDTGKAPAITAATADSAAEWVRRKYPKHSGKMLDPTPEDRTLVQLVKTLRMSGSALEDEKKAAEVALKARLADADGFTGLCSYFKAKDTIESATNWKAVLDELVKEKGLDRGYVLALLKEHTKQIVTRRGSRRLLLEEEV